jgi:hypothetical protein
MQVQRQVPANLQERRRKLAQLLRELRSIRHQRLTREQMIEQFSKATTAAPDDVIRSVRIVLPVGERAYRRVRFRIDKTALNK